MLGSATFTTVTSSTIISIPTHRTTSPIQRERSLCCPTAGAMVAFSPDTFELSLGSPFIIDTPLRPAARRRLIGRAEKVLGEAIGHGEAREGDGELSLVHRLRGEVLVGLGLGSLGRAHDERGHVAEQAVVAEAEHVE